MLSLFVFSLQSYTKIIKTCKKRNIIRFGGVFLWVFTSFVSNNLYFCKV